MIEQKVAEFWFENSTVKRLVFVVVVFLGFFVCFFLFVCFFYCRG